MSKIRVMIADSDMITCQTLKQKISLDKKLDIVGIACDGIDAYNMIHEKHPDVVLMDLILPNLDGVGILENFHCNQFEYNPVFIITSPITNESIIRYIIGLGVSYYIAKPFDMDTIANRIKNVCGIYNDEIVVTTSTLTFKQSSMPLDRRVHNLIYSLGIHPGIKGYDYIKDTLIMTVNDRNVLSHIMTDIYEPLGEKYNTTPHSVERAIRHAIQRACDLKNEYIHEIFSCMINSKKMKPTNKEFLATLTDKLVFEIKNDGKIA